MELPSEVTLLATVIANDEVLLSAKTPRQRAADDEDIDPVMLGFLNFLEKQMAEDPEMIEPADGGQLARIRNLVADLVAESTC